MNKQYGDRLKLNTYAIFLMGGINMKTKEEIDEMERRIKILNRIVYKYGYRKLAQITGINPGTVSRMLNGASRISDEKLAKLEAL